MNDVPWMIKFNTRNLRSPQYYFIDLVIIVYQQIVDMLCISLVSLHNKCAMCTLD